MIVFDYLVQEEDLYKAIDVGTRLLPALIYIIFRLYPIGIAYIKKLNNEQTQKKIRLYEDVALLLIYILHSFIGYKWFIQPNHLYKWIYDDLMVGNKLFDDSEDVYIITKANLFFRWQLMFYFSLAVIVCLAPRKRDFKIMLSHHIFTIILIFTGWFCKFHRLVIFVIIIHDTADVFLQISRLSHRFCFKISSQILFVIFFIFHFVLRVCLFPFISFFGIMHTQNIESFFERFTPLLLLFTIWVLHIWWLILMCRIIYKKLFLKIDVSNLKEIRDNS